MERVISFDLKGVLTFPPLAVQQTEFNICDKLAEIIVTKLLVVIDYRRFNHDGWNTAWVAVNGCRGLCGNSARWERICTIYCQEWDASVLWFPVSFVSTFQLLYQTIAMTLCQRLFSLFAVGPNKMCLIFLPVPVSSFVYPFSVWGYGVWSFYVFVLSQLWSFARNNPVVT